MISKILRWYFFVNKTILNNFDCNVKNSAIDYNVVIPIFSLEITQPARNVPGTSHEGPLKVLTSRTSRGPSVDSKGTNTKVVDLMEKVFLDAIVLALHIYYGLLLEKANIQKF